ncbi:hypothetical protein GWI33_001484 [Rhynchophorus ferrugineus]|uniref:Uncharacterized protein n=1 Tax=Rhynchophorus ferrugineus TaxID=354439 RepID=A0A834MGW8_RHYFE|nr:hypothetical protein GWI33_001484 [Rhynchophorus ferrugineus]
MQQYAKSIALPLYVYKKSIIEQYFGTDEVKIEAWKGKPVHGWHPSESYHDNVNNVASNYYMITGRMFPEWESHLLAMHDQVVPTRSKLFKVYC